MHLSKDEIIRILAGQPGWSCGFSWQPSEPKNALFVLEYYFDSDEMRRLQRRRFLRVVPFSFKLRF
ncbi:hypothetical protein HanOQP8_Chr03g0091191 [Helianthus annuus]|nr:hypothetical protein HanHA89_Chr03g0089811 [Helianthus annuus]KAJ0772767.1 hypothetical protein HanOQP8_Chr03g0091191 [Helianthus annuus]